MRKHKEIFPNMDVDNNFLDAAIKTKAEIDKWDCIKLKESFYIAKEWWIKWQNLMNEEKILVRHYTCDRG